METIEGKTAVVTGAASGIGLAMVRRFARAGAKLVISDIDEAKLGQTLDEVIGLGAAAVAVGLVIGLGLSQRAAAAQLVALHIEIRFTENDSARIVLRPRPAPENAVDAQQHLHKSNLP